MNIESYRKSNLGFFALSGQREVIQEDGEPPDKIFYFGSEGLIALRMTSQAVDDD